MVGCGRRRLEAVATCESRHREQGMPLVGGRVRWDEEAEGEEREHGEEGEERGGQDEEST